MRDVFFAITDSFDNSVKFLVRVILAFVAENPVLTWSLDHIRVLRDFVPVEVI